MCLFCVTSRRSLDLDRLLNRGRAAGSGDGVLRRVLDLVRRRVSGAVLLSVGCRGSSLGRRRRSLLRCSGGMFRVSASRKCESPLSKLLAKSDIISCVSSPMSSSRMVSSARMFSTSLLDGSAVVVVVVVVAVVDVVVIVVGGGKCDAAKGAGGLVPGPVGCSFVSMFSPVEVIGTMFEAAEEG